MTAGQPTIIFYAGNPPYCPPVSNPLFREEPQRAGRLRLFIFQEAATAFKIDFLAQHLQPGAIAILPAGHWFWLAHRLSTVKDAAKIVVLHGGEIVEEGTHESLAAAKGFYYQLVHNQLELGN